MAEQCQDKANQREQIIQQHTTPTQATVTSLDDQEEQPPNLNTSFGQRRVLGFKRAKRNQRPDISLVQIEGVKTAADTEFYLGKRIAFVYRAKREVNGSKIRCIWGRITRAHGGSGAVKARFRNNLPAKSFGASVRVMMYPSRV
ncbi:60S ribosomal protein L33A [Mortierella antarctica]|nr:60S ribosomal protein L33A [Mortierella antarctica]